MAILFVIFCIIRVCTSCSAHVRSKNKVKILEDYVVSANFDRNLALPQLKSNAGQPITAELLRAEQRIINEDRLPEKYAYRRDPTYSKAETQIMFQNGEGERNDLDVYLNDDHQRNVLSERDIAGPPAAALVSAHSLYAIGFITFLILLSSLQASLSVMTKRPGGLLGGKPYAGRKRRSKSDKEFFSKIRNYC